MTKNATIEIRIGSIELTCNGDVDAAQLESVLQTLRRELPDLMRNGAGESTGMTAAQLLASSSARTFGDKAGVAAWWLEHYRGRREWRSGDIVDVLREAGEAVPANITDALNQKLRKGLFEVDDRRWKLSGEGRGWVKFHLLSSEDGE